MLNVVHDWDLAIACENEIAVHAVDGEVRRDRPLACGKAVGDDGSAVDATGSRGVPEWPGVRESVLWR